MKRARPQRTAPASRPTPLHALLAAAILGLLVMPLAFAGAADGPTATSAKVTDAKFKKLKKRVAELERRSTLPTGPAGGDLTGSYPNPEIGPDKVTGAKIPDETLTGFEIAPDSLFHQDLALDSVGSSELKGTAAVVSVGTDPGGGFADQSAQCGAGQTVIGGGFSWDQDAGATIVASTPDPLVNPTRWLVRGGATSAGNTLRAWVVCLGV